MNRELKTQMIVYGSNDFPAERRMIYYIDGDNGPGSRTKGIECLGIHDTVKLFYNGQNNYYKEQKNRKTLLDQGLCQVEFFETQNGNNAVDFAICIDVTKMLEWGNWHDPVICLISADKHFNAMAVQLADRFPDADIITAGTIEDAYLKGGCLALNDISDLKRFLMKKYGCTKGDRIFRNVKQLFENEERRRGKYI